MDEYLKAEEELQKNIDDQITKQRRKLKNNSQSSRRTRALIPRPNLKASRAILY